jgi:hypothetical protein
MGQRLRGLSGKVRRNKMIMPVVFLDGVTILFIEYLGVLFFLKIAEQNFWVPLLIMWMWLLL